MSWHFDGLEQRTADTEERYRDEIERCDIAEQLGDEAVDESLMDIARARMDAFFLDKVLAHG